MKMGVDKLPVMVRPFDLRDLALIRRLDEQGVSLYTMPALAENINPLRGAIVNMLIGGEFPTFIWKSDSINRAGFIQLRIPSGSNQAYVNYISPRCVELPRGDNNNSNEAKPGNDGATSCPDCAIWLELLDAAIIMVGQRGIHHFIAEVDENDPDIQIILRRAGFVVYTRQDVWMVQAADYLPHESPKLNLTRRTPSDEWDIQLLYANTVPRLVQLVEPLPSTGETESWVMREGQELAAFISIRRGTIASWIRLFIHPNAEANTDEIVAAAIDASFTNQPQRVYCCVRRYESWSPGSLERQGFTLYSSQAVMVRHTVHHVMRPAPELALSLEGQRISASPPLVRNFKRPDSNKR